MFIPLTLGMIVIIVVSLLVYIDQKSTYEKIDIYKWTKENGDFYFSVPYYIWQRNKKIRIREIYSQNTILEFQGERFLITHYGGEFPQIKGNPLFEREARYWGEPLTILQTYRNEHLTINQYGSGVINVQLNNTEINNEIINIQEYISGESDLTFDEKEMLLNFIENIYKDKGMRKEEVRNAYDIFLKYEPLLSLSTNIVSLIRNFL